MTVGFTGTRAGMSEDQARQLRYVLAVLRHADVAVSQQTLFLDGDCPKGADRQARQIATSMNCRSETVPPVDGTAPALLARDRAIVERCHVLVACPLTDQERLRSGTWYTVRQARDLLKPVFMLSRGGRLPASDQRLGKALDDECGIMANTVAVEVCSRVPADVQDQMRAYLHRKMRDLRAALWATG